MVLLMYLVMGTSGTASTNSSTDTSACAQQWGGDVGCTFPLAPPVQPQPLTLLLLEKISNDLLSLATRAGTDTGTGTGISTGTCSNSLQTLFLGWSLAAVLKLIRANLARAVMSGLPASAFGLGSASSSSSGSSSSSSSSIATQSFALRLRDIVVSCAGSLDVLGWKGAVCVDVALAPAHSQSSTPVPVTVTAAAANATTTTEAHEHEQQQQQQQQQQQITRDIRADVRCLALRTFVAGLPIFAPTLGEREALLRRLLASAPTCPAACVPMPVLLPAREPAGAGAPSTSCGLSIASTRAHLFLTQLVCESIGERGAALYDACGRGGLFCSIEPVAGAGAGAGAGSSGSSSGGSSIGGSSSTSTSGTQRLETTLLARLTTAGASAALACGHQHGSGLEGEVH
jgi:hypothetical protein